jgi:hypothetical protein
MERIPITFEHKGKQWIFHSNIMPEIGELLNEYVIAWYQ